MEGGTPDSREHTLTAPPSALHLSVALDGAGYGAWVRSIRSGEGAIPFPAPAEARAFRWSDADRALVAGRVDTQLAGSAKQVADQLEQLQEATGGRADHHHHYA